MKFYSLPLIPNQKPNVESFHTDLPQTEENAQVDWQALEEYCSILPSLSPELLESAMDPTFHVGTVNLPVTDSDSVSPLGFTALGEYSNFLPSLNLEDAASASSSSTVSVAESQQESDESVSGKDQTTPAPGLPETPGGIFDINQLFPIQLEDLELDFDTAFAHPLNHDFQQYLTVFYCGWSGCEYLGHFDSQSALMEHVEAMHVGPDMDKSTCITCGWYRTHVQLAHS